MGYLRVKNQWFHEVDQNGDKKGNPYLIEGTIYQNGSAPSDAVPYKLPRLRTKRRAKLEEHSRKYNL